MHILLFFEEIDQVLSTQCCNFMILCNGLRMNLYIILTFLTLIILQSTTPNMIFGVTNSNCLAQY